MNPDLELIEREWWWGSFLLALTGFLPYAIYFTQSKERQVHQVLPLDLPLQRVEM